MTNFQFLRNRVNIRSQRRLRNEWYFTCYLIYKDGGFRVIRSNNIILNGIEEKDIAWFEAIWDDKYNYRYNDITLTTGSELRPHDKPPEHGLHPHIRGENAGYCTCDECRDGAILSGIFYINSETVVACINLYPEYRSPILEFRHVHECYVIYGNGTFHAIAANPDTPNIAEGSIMVNIAGDVLVYNETLPYPDQLPPTDIGFCKCPQCMAKSNLNGILYIGDMGQVYQEHQDDTEKDIIDPGIDYNLDESHVCLCGNPNCEFCTCTDFDGGLPIYRLMGIKGLYSYYRTALDKLRLECTKEVYDNPQLDISVSRLVSQRMPKLYEDCNDMIFQMETEIKRDWLVFSGSDEGDIIPAMSEDVSFIRSNEYKDGEYQFYKPNQPPQYRIEGIKDKRFESIINSWRKAVVKFRDDCNIPYQYQV